MQNEIIRVAHDAVVLSLGGVAMACVAVGLAMLIASIWVK